MGVLTALLFFTVKSENEKGRFHETFRGDFRREKIIKAMDSDSMQSPHFQARGASRLMDLGKTPIKTARLEHHLQF